MKAQEKLAESLLRVKKIAKMNGAPIIRSEQIARADRELLVRTKWLQEIIKGWYLFLKPSIPDGDSSAWYANFWDFLRIYLTYHFRNNYCLSAEASLDLHTASSVIPEQVIVISSKGGGAPQGLPFNTSFFVYSDPKNIPDEKVALRGLEVMTLPYALCKVSPTYFQKNQKEAEIALQLIRNSSDLIEVLLKYNFQSAAARLIGAYAACKNKKFVTEIQHAVQESGWKIKEENPFIHAPLLQTRFQSPYVARIYALWNEFRPVVIQHFPKPPGILKNQKTYFTKLAAIYDKDAYNSLSIEGYEVDEELIAHVQSNQWSPEENPRDAQERDALAARGYYEAFLDVKKSILRIFENENPGVVVEEDLKKWYQSLFAPLARAGIIQRSELFGYRKMQVYIRGSRHVPLPREALADAMDALFQLLQNEQESSVRAVLGHYMFVFIHPFMDGNGRLGRFLMNAMLASGGYPWTIIQTKHRATYFQALETAGTEKNIEPFVRFILQEMGR